MSSGRQGQVHEHAPARAESVAPLRRAIVAFADGCGATDRQREDIAVAVSEALTNAVLHGYAGCREPGVVDVQASVDQGSLQVVVCDAGGGMRPRVRSPGLGVGMSLIARMSRHACFEDASPGVRVRMTFPLG